MALMSRLEPKLTTKNSVTSLLACWDAAPQSTEPNGSLRRTLNSLQRHPRASLPRRWNPAVPSLGEAQVVHAAQHRVTVYLQQNVPSWPLSGQAPHLYTSSSVCPPPCMRR